MANFTDKIPTFTPYIEQFPVHAAVDVGMIKQQRYDEGIRTIQSQIDNVAGIDLLRDVDKSYLQSKLNSLSGDLNKVSAGDFSNFQLVNTVAGMVNKVGKDKTIQNAYSSTVKYKRGLEEMEKAIKEGKSSPSNEYFFNREVDKWINDPSTEASFNGSYRPYTNWKKNGLEVLKSLTKDESIRDDAFTVDSNGRMIISDAIVRRKLAGISPEKIQQALMVGLTPADFQQMEMDGVYSYANLDADKFVKGISSEHNNTIDYYDKQRKVLENAKDSTSSIKERENIDEQIKELDRFKESLNNEMAQITESAYNNLDAAKAQYFTRNAIENFTKAFSFTETSETIHDSPYVKNAQWKADYELEWAKYKQKDKEIELKKKELNGQYGGLPSPIDQSKLPTYSRSKVIDEIETQRQTLANADNAFATQQGQNIDWLNQQREAYEKSPSSVRSPIVREYIEETNDVRRNMLGDAAMLMNIDKMVKEQFPDIYQNIPKDSPDVTYRKDGVSYNYTPRDFVDFGMTLGKYIKEGGSFVSSAGTGGGKGTLYDYDTAKKELSEKEFKLFEIMGKKNPTEAEKKLLQQAQHYISTINIPYNKTLADIEKFTTDEIKKRIAADQEVSYTIPTDKEVDRNAMAGLLSQIADFADKQKGGFANSPEFDSEIARQLATEEKANYSFGLTEGTERVPDNYQFKVSGKAGSINVNLSPEQKRSIFGDKFESLPEVQAIRPYLEQMHKMGGFTTSFSPMKKSSNENAYLQNKDFPRVNIYGVNANIVTLRPKSNKYTIKINVYDPVTKKWYDDIDYPSGGTIAAEDIAQALESLTDSYIYSILNDTKDRQVTVGELKAVEEASKKPL